MQSPRPIPYGARRAPVVPGTHRPVARPRHCGPLVRLIAFAATSLLAFACGPGGTYCQSGPKYGTQCYDLQQQGAGNTTPAQNGRVYPTAANSRNAPNGQKP
jgi:hypothetical protein